MPGNRPRPKPRSNDLAGFYDTAGRHSCYCNDSSHIISDATLRKRVGKLNVARVSFKEKFLEDVEVSLKRTPFNILGS
jgi:hypothetical protein